MHAARASTPATTCGNPGGGNPREYCSNGRGVAALGTLPALDGLTSLSEIPHVPAPGSWGFLSLHLSPATRKPPAIAGGIFFAQLPMSTWEYEKGDLDGDMPKRSSHLWVTRSVEVVWRLPAL